eukprot:scaffold2827_cov409-Prasinococcus_capsulatus_cf.AAC.6
MGQRNTRQERDGQGLGTVYFICGGARGDQQPVAMVAAQMKRMGYEVVLCVGAEGQGWVCC